MAFVEANRGLPSIGLSDCGTNLFSFVADKVGYTHWDVDATNLYINQSLPGPLELWGYSKYCTNWPISTTNGICSAGNGMLKSVIDAFEVMPLSTTTPPPFLSDAVYGLDVNIP